MATKGDPIKYSFCLDEEVERYYDDHDAQDNFGHFDPIWQGRYLNLRANSVDDSLLNFILWCFAESPVTYENEINEDDLLHLHNTLGILSSVSDYVTIFSGDIADLTNFFSSALIREKKRPISIFYAISSIFSKITPLPVTDENLVDFELLRTYFVNPQGSSDTTPNYHWRGTSSKAVGAVSRKIQHMLNAYQEYKKTGNLTNASEDGTTKTKPTPNHPNTPVPGRQYSSPIVAAAAHTEKNDADVEDQLQNLVASITALYNENRDATFHINMAQSQHTETFRAIITGDPYRRLTNMSTQQNGHGHGASDSGADTSVIGTGGSHPAFRRHSIDEHRRASVMSWDSSAPPKQGLAIGSFDTVLTSVTGERAISCWNQAVGNPNSDTTLCSDCQARSHGIVWDSVHKSHTASIDGRKGEQTFYLSQDFKIPLVMKNELLTFTCKLQEYKGGNSSGGTTQDSREGINSAASCCHRTIFDPGGRFTTKRYCLDD